MGNGTASPKRYSLKDGQRRLEAALEKVDSFKPRSSVEAATLRAIEETASLMESAHCQITMAQISALGLQSHLESLLQDLAGWEQLHKLREDVGNAETPELETVH